ncbi:MAG: FkbM family methyltransferase, partial [Pseudomonadota bacterium]
MWRQLRRRLALRRLHRGPGKADAFTILRDKGVPVSSVIDVGVLDGTPELMEAYPEVPHLLIEPLEDVQDKIYKRYTDAGITYDLVQAAASDTPGEIILHTKSAGASITHARLDAPGNGTSTAARTARALPLDDILSERGLPAPSLLKIDVDGAELAVLRGAQKVLTRCSVVCIEASVATIFERSAPLTEA